jgi:sec-independent protein translocase protein TatC
LQEPLFPTAPTAPSQDPTERMSVIEHLEELRWRIFKSLGTVVVAAAAIFGFNNQLIEMLERPLKGGVNPFVPALKAPVQLIFTTPTEYFMAVVKISLLGGIYLALPVLLYQIVSFVGPGLTPGEKRWTLPVVGGSFVLFTLGMLFSYYLILPPGIQFLVGFAPSDVKALLSIGKYINFASGVMFATGLAFQLPLFLLGASAMGLVTSYSLARYRRQALFAAFVLAAILSPSIDLFSQGILAFALYLLFELSMVLIRLTGK